MLGQYLLAQRRRLVEDALDLLVDDARRLLRVALGGAEVTAYKDAVVGAVEGNGSEPVAHTVLRDHIPCGVGRLLNVARCTGGYIVKEQLFGHSAAERHNDALEHLAL